MRERKGTELPYIHHGATPVYGRVLSTWHWRLQGAEASFKPVGYTKKSAHGDLLSPQNALKLHNCFKFLNLPRGSQGFVICHILSMKPLKKFP